MRRVTLVCAVTVMLATTTQALANITEVVPADEGSSDPTYFATNHRVAVTSRGRMLVIHGRHASGVQLRWKDRGSNTWHIASKGAVLDGMLLDGTGSGDWPSSIVVAKGGDGKERAWVVIGDVNFADPAPVRMRVLSRLDAAGGPTVGPLVIVDNASLGDAFVDVGMERRPSGKLRGAVVFVRKVAAGDWRLVVTWFTDLNTDTPSFAGAHALLRSSTGRRQSTLVRTARGMAVIARGAEGRITMFAHNRNKRLTRWRHAGTGVSVVAKAKPSATGLPNGDVLVAVEDKVVGNHVTLQRFSPRGRVKTVLRASGFSMPSVANAGKKAWVVMIRDSDGVVVSRGFRPTKGWGKVRLEVGAGHGDHYAWPNTLRSTKGFLRFVVRAGRFGVTRSGVVAVVRRI